MFSLVSKLAVFKLNAQVLSTVRQGAAEAATGSKVRELAQESYTRHSAVEVQTKEVHQNTVHFDRDPKAAKSFVRSSVQAVV
eukprot:2727427-Amphidinium_carterae.1